MGNNNAAFALILVFAIYMPAMSAENAFAAQTNTATATQPASAKNSKSKSIAKKAEKTEQKSETKLMVYYFHGYARCSSCRKIEQYAKEAAESLALGAYAGRVAFSAVNVEEGANEHYVKDYRLVSKAVILQPEKDGKPGAWENLDRIWLELGDKNKFTAYIKEHIIKQLEAK